MCCRKIFDICISPFEFGSDKLFHFLERRFVNAGADVQEQRLCWMQVRLRSQYELDVRLREVVFSQILTRLDIAIPLESVLVMFADGVASLPLARVSDVTAHDVLLQQTSQVNVDMEDIPVGSPLSPGNRHASSEPRVFTFDVPQSSETEFKNITCFIMMLDVILQQVRVQQAPAHAGVVDELNNERMLDLMTRMLLDPWEGRHSCGSEATSVCDHCTLTSQWFSLALQVGVLIRFYYSTLA